MKNISLLLLVLIAAGSFSCGDKKSVGISVTFPEIIGPTQITSNDKEHFFASYYGINSFDKSQRYATVLETDIKYELPDESDPATLGLVDLATYEFMPLAVTHAGIFSRVHGTLAWYFTRLFDHI